MALLRILGVDPGFGRTGVGIVDLAGGGVATHVFHEVIETPKTDDFSERLAAIRERLRIVIDEYTPVCAVVESLFFQTNVTTAINVGMARGVILLTVRDAGIPVIDLTPNQVKQGITGYGSADKKQVQDMVKRTLKLQAAPRLDDAADALALAVVGGLIYRTTVKK